MKRGRQEGEGEGEEKEVPAKGGPVLLLDRSTRNMTADEFKAAKLAGTD